MQEGDVHLFQTADDGDISVANGIVEMTGGLETAAYISIFGGNEDDDGSNESSQTWWANLNEVEQQYQFRSETQNILQALPATSGNLIKVTNAVKRDLNWFLTLNIASSVLVAVSMPALNTICIEVNVSANGEEKQFQFTENWKARGQTGAPISTGSRQVTMTCDRTDITCDQTDITCDMI
jgi:phage gp46-like protein